MPLHICKHCGGSDVDKDPARGDSVCMGCGAVLEENVIVAEVEFQESGLGSQSMVGQYVSADWFTVTSIGGGQTATSQTSREVTIQNARRSIQKVASQLRVNQQCADSALNFYKMALSRAIVRGRRSLHVFAACLYITCRLEGTAHLLLDFSDALQVNVFELGRMYTYLARSLYVKLPPTDPCVYVLRFAQRLNFREKEHEVAMIALRIVQRMKRDWLGFGRRPTGLCGAALLLAARFYGFRRTLDDIIRVVNIGGPVLKRRLDEFSLTPSGKLTMEEFKVVDLEEECDPPAFTESKFKNNDELQKKFVISRKEVLETQRDLEKILHENFLKRAIRVPFLRASDVMGDEEVSSAAGDGGEEDELWDISSEIHDVLNEPILDDILQSGAMQDLATASAPTDDQQLPQKLVDEPTPAARYDAFRPTLQSLGIAESLTRDAAADRPSTTPEMEVHDAQSWWGDLDDDDIESYLLTPNEVKFKTKWWTKRFSAFLTEQERKRAERLLEQENAPKKKKVRRKPPIQATSAKDAIEKVVARKSMSRKINYEILRALTDAQVEVDRPASTLVNSQKPVENDADSTFATSAASASTAVSAAPPVAGPKEQHLPGVDRCDSAPASQTGAPSFDNAVKASESKSKSLFRIRTKPKLPSATSVK